MARRRDIGVNGIFSISRRSPHAADIASAGAQILRCTVSRIRAALQRSSSAAAIKSTGGRQANLK
jgi:hypothetical protein